jgi:FSR family fosmidomycin resistance protein-like MFS transporter
LSAAAGAVTGGVLSVRVSRRGLVSGTLLLALLPLFAIFALEPGTLPYFLAVILAGALIHTGSPLLIISAQDLAPHAIATASGMLMGLTTGTAGVLYIGVGRLQEAIGLAPAMGISFLSVIPAALVAFYVLTKYSTPSNVAVQTTATDRACVCTACLCIPCTYVTTPATTQQIVAQR